MKGELTLAKLEKMYNQAKDMTPADYILIDVKVVNHINDIWNKYPWYIKVWAKISNMIERITR